MHPVEWSEGVVLLLFKVEMSLSSVWRISFTIMKKRKIG